MKQILDLDSKVAFGRGRHKKVSDIIANKSAVFKLIKDGYIFSDELLAMAGIKKIVHEPTTTIQIVEHQKDNTVLPKERKNVETICRELYTIENQAGQDTTFNEADDDIDEIFEEDENDEE